MSGELTILSNVSAEPSAAGGQESTAVRHHGLMAFLTFTGPAAFHSTKIRVSFQLL